MNDLLITGIFLFLMNIICWLLFFKHIVSYVEKELSRITEPMEDLNADLDAVSSDLREISERISKRHRKNRKQFKSLRKGLSVVRKSLETDDNFIPKTMVVEEVETVKTADKPKLKPYEILNDYLFENSTMNVKTVGVISGDEGDDFSVNFIGALSASVGDTLIVTRSGEVLTVIDGAKQIAIGLISETLQIGDIVQLKKLTINPDVKEETVQEEKVEVVSDNLSIETPAVLDDTEEKKTLTSGKKIIDGASMIANWKQRNQQ